MTEADLDTPLTCREILLRCEHRGDSISRVAERLVALAAVLVKDLDHEDRASLAFFMTVHADFLVGATSNEVAH
jgi:hypothetical protein